MKKLLFITLLLLTVSQLCKGQSKDKLKTTDSGLSVKLVGGDTTKFYRVQWSDRPEREWHELSLVMIGKQLDIYFSYSRGWNYFRVVDQNGVQRGGVASYNKKVN